MIRNALIALTAASAMAIAVAPAAEAKTKINLDFGVNLGGGGIYVGNGYGYYDDDVIMIVDDGCGWQKVKHVKIKANGKKKVWYTKEYVCG